MAPLSFGSDEFGALGHGAAARSFAVPPRLVRGAVRVVRVAAGATHSLFLSQFGEVFSSGSGVRGALGLGDAADRAEATRVRALEGVPVVDVAAGDNVSHFVAASGLCYTSGYSKNGALGLGDTAQATLPAPVAALPERTDAVRCGDAHTAWVARSGRLYVAGLNRHGQCGGGVPAPGAAAECVRLPASVELPSGARVRDVALGARHTLILAADGSVFAMGDSASGQTGVTLPLPPAPGVEPNDDPPPPFATRSGLDLGHAAGACLWAPTRIPGLSNVGVFRIAAGGSHSLALRTKRGWVRCAVPCRGPFRFVDAAGFARLGQAAAQSGDLAPLTAAISDVFSRASSICGSFVMPDAPAGAFEARVGPHVVEEDWAGDGNAQGEGGAAAELMDLDALPESPVSASSGDSAGDSSDGASFAPPSAAGIDPAGGLAPLHVGPQLPAAACLETSRVDFPALETAFNSMLQTFSPEVVETLVRCQLAALAELESLAHSLTLPDSLRVLLILFACPVNARPAVSQSLLARLCAVILSLPPASRSLLMTWIACDLPGVLFGARFVKALEAHLTHHLEHMATATQVPFAATRAVPAEMQLIPLRDGELHITHLVGYELCLRMLKMLYAVNESQAQEIASGFLHPTQKSHSRAVRLFAEWLRSRNDVLDPLLPRVETSPWSSRWNALSAPCGALVSYDTFYNQGMQSLPLPAFQMEYQRWARVGFQSVETSPPILFNYAFLLDPSIKRKIVLQEALQMMQHEANNAMAQSFFSAHHPEPFLVLRIRRDHLVNDVLNQLMAHQHELHKQLRVIFQGEEAIDEGGVRKEMFQLLVREVFSMGTGMFMPAGEAGRELWFNPAALPESEREFYLVGLIIGLAIFNGITLDVQLCMPLYKRLLGFPMNILDLHEVNPDLATGLISLLLYEKNDVEDVFALTFEASYESFGQVISVELVPGGKDIPVSASNKFSYVERYMHWYLVDSVDTNFQHFLKGFRAVMNGAFVRHFRGEELQLLVAGTPHLDFKALEENCRYEGGYSKTHPTIRAFWRVLHSLPYDQQKKFLSFATGCSKAPIGGLGHLLFSIQRSGSETSRLPTASTCFHILLLPDYGDDETTMRQRLDTAINECSGFGLR
jgi:hypothetical protein